MIKHTLKLKPKRERSVLNKHPWIFSGAVDKVSAGIENGELVKVYDAQDNFLCIAFYHKGSITGRILSFDEITPDSLFFKQKISAAFSCRVLSGIANNPHTNAWRLVNAEGDGMSGLIIDNYNGHFVIQEHHNGWASFREHIQEAIHHIFKGKVKTIFLKKLEYQKAEEDESGHFLFGENTADTISENGIQFKVDWQKGQKTGFFLDQRENRLLLKSLSAGKKVLNTFCYTGGFSAYAMSGGAASVTGVDISADAVEMAEENMQLNGFRDNYTGIKANVNEYLKEAAEDFDIIIVDPPAFAKSRSHIKNAIKGYRRLNQQAISKVKSGGLIFTFSCSQAIDELTFGKVVFEAASASGRNVQILHRLSQPADHPVNIFHPEGQYLKGLVLLIN